MILEISIVIISVILCAYYFMYYSPKSKIQKFAKYAQTLGYRVKQVPFNPMQYYMAPFEQQHNGSLKTFKYDIPNNYDLIVGNMFGTLAIIPVSTQLQKDFYNSMSKLHKNPFVTEVLHKYLNGGGLLCTQGEIWHRKRRIMSAVFNFDFINEIVPAIDGLIQHYLCEVDTAIQQKKTINIQKLMVKTLSSVIAKCFFGTDMRQHQIQGRAYSDYFLSYLDQMNQFTMSTEHALLGMLGARYGLTRRSREINRKLAILRACTREITIGLLQNLHADGQHQPKNLLTTLSQSNLLNFDQQQQSNEKYSLQQLIGEFFTFVGAGTDTSSHSINLMLHYLSEYPQYVEKLRDEAGKISKQTGLTTGERLKRMVWADAVFNEVQRINGPVSEIVPRISVEKLQIGKLSVPKGTCFNVLPLINHYHPLYFPSPDTFSPERWMGDHKVQPYAFMPFAGGQRNCIGQYLARVEAKLILTKIVERYDFKAVYPIKMRKQFFFVTGHGDFQFKKRL